MNDVTTMQKKKNITNFNKQNYKTNYLKIVIVNHESCIFRIHNNTINFKAQKINSKSNK